LKAEETPKKVEDKQPEPLQQAVKAEEKKQPIQTEEKPVEKKGFFQRFAEKFTTASISEQKFNELFWELEVMLLENSVAVEVIEKLKNDLKEALVDKPFDRSRIAKIVDEKLKESIEELFTLKIGFNKDDWAEKTAYYHVCRHKRSGKTTL